MYVVIEKFSFSWDSAPSIVNWKNASFYNIYSDHHQGVLTTLWHDRILTLLTRKAMIYKISKTDTVKSTIHKSTYF